MTTVVEKYSLGARIFHWIGALLIVAAWVLIEQGESFIGLHKAVGFSFLIWTILRIVNRVITKAPPPVPMSKLQTMVASLVHLALYAVMIAMPVTGLLGTLAEGQALSVFGLFEIAGFATVNYDLADQMMALHKDVVWTALLALIVAHIAGALYHQFVVKDNLIARMR